MGQVMLMYTEISVKGNDFMWNKWAKFYVLMSCRWLLWRENLLTERSSRVRFLGLNVTWFMRIFEDKIIGRPATDSGQLMLYREIMAVCS